MKKIITIKELMQILKPVKTCGFMTMCANYAREINSQYESRHSTGQTHYEISGIKTKSGNPHVIFFNY